jgi:hypothetical protein
MKLTKIGNCKNWLKDEWTEYAMTHKGRTPHAYKDSDTYNQWLKWGYKKHLINSHSFEPGNFPFEMPFPLDVEHNKSDYNYTITRYNPGEFVPYHVDFVQEYAIKLWISLQDYQPGHIFIYKSEILTDYKKGDMFIFDGNSSHLAGNIGISQRAVLTYDIWGELMTRILNQYDLKLDLNDSYIV